MRKAKPVATSERSASGFTDQAMPAENEALSFAKTAPMSKSGKDSLTTEHKILFTILKQVFFFLPGTFLLFYMSFGAAVIAMEILVYRREIETLPDDFPFHFALIGLALLLGTLLTWFGLGDIRNRKHLAIPGSLVVTGAFSGAIVKATASIFDLAHRMLDDFSYLIWLFPLALVIPTLAKGMADWKAEDE